MGCNRESRRKRNCSRSAEVHPVRSSHRMSKSFALLQLQLRIRCLHMMLLCFCNKAAFPAVYDNSPCFLEKILKCSPIAPISSPPQPRTVALLSDCRNPTAPHLLRAGREHKYFKTTSSPFFSYGTYLKPHPQTIVSCQIKL